MLSRVTWPACEVERVFGGLREHQGKLKRVCIQAVNYPGVVNDILELVSRIKESCNLPISISCQPLTEGDIEKLDDAGIDRIGIPLDAATPAIFERIKGSEVGGPYEWSRHLQALEEARSILGLRVSTHLIIGLGETEQEAVETIQFLHDRGVTVGLFAFTPILGTPLANRNQPDPPSYRRVQLARYLIVNNLTKAERMRFDDGRLVDFGVSQEALCRVVNSGEPFRTSGCPDCNRPFYNESPRGPIYNYAWPPSPRELKEIQKQLAAIYRPCNF
jgi:biotin synthase